jgi:Family of unknown function (DUF6510)
MTDDLHIDGNGVAGLLGEIAAVEVTTMLRTCQGCGERHPVGAHRAYRGAGVVLRCPSCGAVAATIAVREDRLLVDWGGVFECPRAG